MLCPECLEQNTDVYKTGMVFLKNKLEFSKYLKVAKTKGNIFFTGKCEGTLFYGIHPLVSAMTFLCNS